MVDAVMVPSCNSNCQDDIDDFLLTLGSINKKKHVQPLLPSPTAYDVMVKTLPENLKSLLKVGPFPVEETDPLSKQEKNTIAYICGYIIRKVRNLICGACQIKLIISGDSKENDCLDFIKLKKHSGAKDGLISPSSVLISVVSRLEIEYRKIIDDLVYSDHVKARLVLHLCKQVSLVPVSCKSCHFEVMLLHILINIRFHHTLKEANSTLSTSKSRKNRKVLKFSHL